jgi:hypothetical protein
MMKAVTADLVAEANRLTGIAASLRQGILPQEDHVLTVRGIIQRLRDDDGLEELAGMIESDVKDFEADALQPTRDLAHNLTLLAGQCRLAGRRQR